MHGALAAGRRSHASVPRRMRPQRPDYFYYYPIHNLDILSTSIPPARAAPRAGKRTPRHFFAAAALASRLALAAAILASLASLALANLRDFPRTRRPSSAASAHSCAAPRPRRAPPPRAALPVSAAPREPGAGRRSTPPGPGPRAGRQRTRCTAAGACRGQGGAQAGPSVRAGGAKTRGTGGRLQDTLPVQGGVHEGRGPRQRTPT